MTYLGFTLILIGMFFILSGIIALYRFKDFYSKLHAGGVIECCGVPICFIGLSFIQNDYASSFKLIFIAILIWILNPVSTFALARASILFKIDNEGKLK
ncbi:MAG: Na+/H+ antiporter subunit G [Rickettsiales bacterium]|nr:MAG: Na+/H+ antiporter subunit G [Rickettsiales bacterium]